MLNKVINTLILIVSFSCEQKVIYFLKDLESGTKMKVPFCQKIIDQKEFIRVFYSSDFKRLSDLSANDFECVKYYLYDTTRPL